MFYKDESLALFIDGSSLHSAARSLGFDIDYKLLRAEFARRGRLVRATYYSCISEGEDYTPVKPLTDWLDYNGFNVVSKPMREFTDHLGRRKQKGSIAIELATDALTLAATVQHMVFFTGEGDYRYVIAALQRQGVRVSVVSTLKTTPPMVADDLRRQADNFIELNELQDVIARPSRPQAE